MHANQGRFGMYITDMHMCLCKLSCTRLVHTRVLCPRASMSSISRAHACIYASERKTCHVEYMHMVHVCLVKFKILSCTIPHVFIKQIVNYQHTCILITYVFNKKFTRFYWYVATQHSFSLSKNSKDFRKNVLIWWSPAVAWKGNNYTAR